MKKYIFKEKFKQFDFASIHNNPQNIYEENKTIQALSNIWCITIFLISFVVGVTHPFFNKAQNNLNKTHFTETKHKSLKNNDNQKIYTINSGTINSIDLIMSDPVKEESNYLKNYIN